MLAVIIVAAVTAMFGLVAAATAFVVIVGTFWLGQRSQSGQDQFEPDGED